jgi:CHAT domain-containing protein
LHAELVTVSACRSAGERAYAGEGLVGFAWAFLRAGAFRNAKLALIQGGGALAKPYYWAPFEVFTIVVPQ